MIVITGASSGIGFELTKLYREAGKTVVNISRRTSDLASKNIQCDLAFEDEISRAVSELSQVQEPIEAIVNCIGIYSDEVFSNVVQSEAEKVIRTNAIAPMVLISRLLHRIKEEGTDILNVISTAGTKGSKRNPVYVASKYAERGFTHSLQDELADTPCRVISFCPGGIQTDFFQKADAIVDTANWMDPKAIALFMKQILDLPKSMQVSEVIINRKERA